MRSFTGQPCKWYTSSSLTFHCLELSRKHSMIAAELWDRVHLSAFEKEEKQEYWPASAFSATGGDAENLSVWSESPRK